jgi:GAF domain-containing protein
MSDLSVLCVDGDDAARSATVAGLRDELSEPELRTATRLQEAVDAIEAAPVDCVLTEYELPDGTGVDLLRTVRERYPDTGCILFTGAEEMALEGDLVVEYLAKGVPAEYERLARIVRTTAAFRSQASYPLPEAEGERVETIEAYGLDADRLRPAIERVTTLAASHFGVDTASVNIVREHSQEFLACHGAAWTPIDREDSICTFTILEDGVMTVDDIRADPRFESNEALAELGIRAYMGATLTTEDGVALGSLCVYDDEPRSFSDADSEYLRVLAGTTMDLIDMNAALEGGAGT